MAYLKLNGYDILPLIAEGGLKWTSNDIDAPDSGRTMDGTMHRGKVCSKQKLEIKFMPLESSKIRAVLQIVENQYVTMSTDIDPIISNSVRTMYNSTRPSTCFHVDKKSGVGTWNDLTLNLIEQ